MNVAVLGYGTVGKSVVDIIDRNIDYMNVTKILRSERATIDSKDNERMTKNFDDILNDETIDSVVECIGGLSPSFEYVSKCMNAGKNVVTANKYMFATYYNELLDLSEKNDVYIMFEATVGGGIPWIENLSRVGYVDTVTGFKGILNGTTNYILDNMTRNGLDFDPVLAEAQKLGYAEKDPTSDIDGFDVLYKTIISANVASRMSYDMSNVIRLGIRNITKSDIEYFAKNNKIIKLIGEFDAKNEIVLVMPMAFDKNLQIAMTPLNYNYVELNCETEGTLAFFGPGAGGHPTAHSIIQDLVRVEQQAFVPDYTTSPVKVDYKNYVGDFYVRYEDGTVEIKKAAHIEDIANDKNIKFVVKM